MFFGGWLERKIGPRLSTMFGSSLMTLGVLLSYVTIKVSFWLLLLTYGLLFGLGLGIAYVAPLVCAMRWMPRWKGVAAGFVLAGLGLGALIFDPVQTAFINPDNLPGDADGYFKDDDLLDRVPLIFPILGGIYAVMQLIGSLLIVNPPEKEEEVPAESKDKNLDEKHGMKRAENFFKSAGDTDLYSPYSGNYSQPLEKHGKESPKAELPPQSLSESNGVVNGSEGNINSIKEAEDSFSSQDEGSHLLSQKLNARQSSDRRSSDTTTNKLSATRMKNLNRSADLEGSISSVTSTSSQNVVVSLRPGQMLKKFNFYLLWAMMFLSGFATIFTASLYKVFGFSFTSDDHFLAIVGATASICNCAGRIVWGLVADVISYKFALVLQSGIMTAFLLTFYSSSVAGKPMFLIWVCIIFFCLGGIFSLYPTAVSRSFGPQYMGINYGLLFTSQIGSAIFSVLILSTLQNVLLSWYEIVFLMSGFSFLSFLLILIFRQKRYVMLELGR